MNEKTIQFLQIYPTTVLKCRRPGHADLNTGLLKYIDELHRVAPNIFHEQTLSGPG